MIVPKYKRIAQLILKYRNGTLSDSENKELQDWSNACVSNQLLLNNLNRKEFVEERLTQLKSVDVSKEWERIKKRMTNRDKD